MGIMNIKVTKANRTIAVDTSELPDEAYQFVLQKGLEALMNARMSKILTKDLEGDKLAEALAEVKRLQAEVRILKERINGLMNEKNEAIRAAKMWQRRCEKAEKAA